jgi:Gas vesicle protein
MYSTDGQNQPSSGQVQRSGSGRNYLSPSGSSTNLADILERVLDKGVVIAGDITIYLADVQLLSIKIRLLVASVDKAKEMGINWWQSDPALSTRAQRLEEENRALRDRLDRLESRLSPPSATEGQPGTPSSEGA